MHLLITVYRTLYIRVTLLVGLMVRTSRESKLLLVADDIS